MASKLYTRHELAFRTQYAELKDRVIGAGELLAGTPGALALRKGTGHAYWYRVYYPYPGRQAEEIVGKDGDDQALQAMRDRIAFAEWVATQVSHLRKLGFQAADKKTARVLVQLHNQGAFKAGLVVVGTVGYMALLNELGLRAVAPRTMDVDLARGETLRLATPLRLLDLLQATGLPFTAVPRLRHDESATSVKLPGVEGLRIDLLAPGTLDGKPVDVPELGWAAQGLPGYEYLLANTMLGAILAGGHCIPVHLPDAGRFAVHKLYSSVLRRGAREKADKDRHQALTLIAAMAEDDDSTDLAAALREAPASIVDPLRAARISLLRAFSGHEAARAMLDQALGDLP